MSTKHAPTTRCLILNMQKQLEHMLTHRVYQNMFLLLLLFLSVHEKNLSCAVKYRIYDHPQKENKKYNLLLPEALEFCKI